MKLPWRNQAGLAKAAAILGTTLGIATGLCGANFVAFLRFGGLNGPPSPPGISSWLGRIIVVTGILELVVIAVSVIGLLAIVLITIARAIKNHFTNN